MRTSTLFGLLVLAVIESACDNKNAGAASASASAAVLQPATLSSALPLAKDPSAKVVKIVFVGKEHACDCTRKKVDSALAALKQVLGEPPRIPVEMLKVDTDEAKVEPYRKQQPMVAIPAIYFVDGKDTVLQMLQGEVNAEQISQALGKSKPST